MAQNRYYSSTAASAQLSGSLTSGTTTFTVTTATGWPASTPFTLVLERDTANEEVVTVTSVTGTTVTCTRGSDGTTAVAHATGAKVEHGVSARDYDEPQKHIAASTNVHGLAVGSAVAGTTDTQTLVNKTLTSPTIGSFINAAHDHAGAAGGSLLTQAHTHSSPDTDAATTSLHHTLGTGANQATPGTHPSVSSGTHGVTGALVGTTDSQTLTNKNLVLPVISQISVGVGTLTLPSGTDVLVGRATTDILTNKTLNGAVIDSTSSIGGVAGSAISNAYGAWTSYTPAVSNITSPTMNAYYKLVGKTLFLRVHFTGGNASSTGTIGFNLPAGMFAVLAGTQILPSNGVAASFTMPTGSFGFTSTGSLTSGAGVNGIVCSGSVEVG